MPRLNLTPSTSSVDKRKFKRMSKEKVVTINMFGFITGFAFSWTPYAFVSMWCWLKGCNDIPPMFHSLLAIFAKSSMVWSPLLFILGIPTIRERIMCSKKQAKVNPN